MTGEKRLAGAVVADAVRSAQSLSEEELDRFEAEVVPRVARLYRTVYAANIKAVFDHFTALRNGERPKLRDWPQVWSDEMTLSIALREFPLKDRWDRCYQAWRDRRWLRDPKSGGKWSAAAGIDHGAVLDTLTTTKGGRPWETQDIAALADRFRGQEELKKYLERGPRTP